MSELKNCPFCGQVPMLDEGTWVMPGCPCFPRYTRIHIKVWNCRADDAGRLREAFSRVRDKAVALRVAAERVINRPRTWRELIAPKMELATALDKLSQAEIASLPASPSAEPCCHTGCEKCDPPAPAKEDEKR